MIGWDLKTLERIRDLLVADMKAHGCKELGAGTIGRALATGDIQRATAMAIENAERRGNRDAVKRIIGLLWREIHGDECAEQQGKPREHMPPPTVKDGVVWLSGFLREANDELGCSERLSVHINGKTIFLRDLGLNKGHGKVHIGLTVEMADAEGKQY